MKKSRIFYLILFIPAAFLVFLIVCPAVNDMTAYSVSQTVWETPLPPGTVKIEKASMAGKLVGSGNGMQYFGAILIKSDTSLDDLKKYYAEYSQNEWSYLVEEQSTKEVNEIEHGTLSFKTDPEEDGYYIVYSWGEGVKPFCEFDLRGH